MLSAAAASNTQGLAFMLTTAKPSAPRKQVDASFNWTAELKYAQQQLTERGGGGEEEEELMFVKEARRDYTLEINNGHCEPHTLRRPQTHTHSHSEHVCMPSPLYKHTHVPANTHTRTHTQTRWMHTHTVQQCLCRTKAPPRLFWRPLSLCSTSPPLLLSSSLPPHTHEDDGRWRCVDRHTWPSSPHVCHRTHCTTAECVLGGHGDARSA